MDLLFQIIDTLNRILQLDQSIEVRRAAVLVIGLILKGLGSDAFRVLESALRDIWYKPRLQTFAQALLFTHRSTVQLPLAQQELP